VGAGVLTVLVTVWSVKGGSGVSVVSAALAVVLARRRGRALVVDLVGDQPAVLGLPEPSGPGLREWLATPDGTPDALDRLVLDVSPSLGLLPAGTVQDWPDARAADLVSALIPGGPASPGGAGGRSGPAAVVVDGGVAGRDPLTDAFARAGVSLLVTRPCYLSLRRAVRHPRPADGVVLVADAGRALDRRDVEQVLGLPVLCTVQVDPVVSRAVDAGVLVTRLPKVLERSLRAVA
jgi:hypothetical protein